MKSQRVNNELVMKKTEDSKESLSVNVQKKDVRIDAMEDTVPAVDAPQRIARRSTPKQDKLKAEIAQFSAEIEALKILINGPNPRLVDRTALSRKVALRHKSIAALKRCQALQRASKKHRKRWPIF